MSNYLRTIWSLLLIGLFSLSSFTQETELANDLKKHVSILAADSLEGRGIGTNGREKARDYIVNEFIKAGLTPFNDSYLQPFRFRQNLSWIDCNNIVGFVEGSDPKLKNEYIVVGAHYDHLGYEVEDQDTIYYLGADDNASGTAGVIELAKHFGQLEEKPKRSIIFICFDAEESGLYGAYHFADNPPILKEQIKLMFSLDMIGMLATYGGLDLKGLGLLKDGEAVVEKLANTLDIKLKDKSPQVEQQTDTAPFGEIGVPAVHVFTGLESPYHKPEDKSDLLEYEGMAKVVQFMEKSLIEFANVEELIPAVKTEDLKAGGKIPFVSMGVTLQNGWGTHDFIENFYRGRNVYNVATGAAINFRLTKNLRLTSQLLADYNGSSSFNGTLRRISFTAPVMFQVGTTDNNSFFRLYGNFGGFYRNNLFASSGGTDLTFTNGFEQEEYGMSVGLGVQIMKFDFYYTYRRTLSDNRIQNVLFQDINQMLGVSYRLF